MEQGKRQDYEFRKVAEKLFICVSGWNRASYHT